MEVERICSVCAEEAPMFCRLCNLHYCPDHLCLHLNVAWETNTWTKRNNNDSQGSRIPEKYAEAESSDCEFEHRERDAIPNTPKSLLSYTEAQLQAQYNFYLSQARRIRTELERRAVFIASVETSERRSNGSFAGIQHTHNKPRRNLPRSATYAYEFLLDKLRQGHISADQVTKGIAQMSALVAAKKQSRS